MALKKISELASQTSVADEDYVVFVDDPTGTPTTKRSTRAGLFKESAVFGAVGTTTTFRKNGSVATDYLLVAEGLTVVVRTVSNDPALGAQVDGDSDRRFTVMADGRITWGSGAASGDTNLYRSAANTLKTDDRFIAGGGLDITVGSDATGDVYYRNSSGNVARLGIGSAGQVLQVSGGLPVWAANTPGTEFGDNVFRLTDDADPTKKVSFQISGVTAGATREITVPNADLTLVGTDTAQTLTQKTLTAPKFASGGFIADANGNEMVIFTTAASAVNEFEMVNSATGSPVILRAHGGDTNVHMLVQAKGSALVKFSVLRQDITTNTYKHNSVVLTGWGFVAGGAAPGTTTTVTFGITFAAAPIVIMGALGVKQTSDPTAIGDFTIESTTDQAVCAATDITTGGMTVTVSRAANNLTAGNRWGFTWIAIAEL